MPRVPFRAIVLASLVLSLLADRVALADEGDPEDGGGAAGKDKRSHFTFAFAGGAMIPRGEMKDAADGGLDVEGRFGWTAGNGLGFVVNLEYALFRRPAPEGRPPAPPDRDAVLVAATAAPRFTLGKQTVRVWVAAGGGVVMERVGPPGTFVDGGGTTLHTAPALTGTGGLDFNLFGAAGLSVAGGYTRSFSDDVEHDFFSLNAGLVFSI